MTDEGDFPTTDDLAASTKRLADWTFSLQGVGADLKALMTEFKTYWRGMMPAIAEGVTMAPLIPESKEAGRGLSMRQGSNVNYSPTVEHSKLLPMLMMTAVFSGIALGVSIMTVIYVNHNQSTLERASDVQYRQIQEYRIRTEDAENAVVQVNPNFHPKR